MTGQSIALAAGADIETAEWIGFGLELGTDLSAGAKTVVGKDCRGAVSLWQKTKDMFRRFFGGKNGPSCFVAGTPVWVLKDGVDAEEANAALEAGADVDDFAITKPIEEIEPGDYVLSRPDDDPNGPLSFQRVLETTVGVSEDVQWLTLRDEVTGQMEVIGSANHSFWVSQTTPEHPWAPIVNVRKSHAPGQSHPYARSLAEVTDRWITAEHYRQGWVLVAPDGSRTVLVERADDDGRAADGNDVEGAAAGPSAVSALLAARGWVSSADFAAGYVLATADGRHIIVADVLVEQRRRAVYNLRVENIHSFFVAELATWAHNEYSPVRLNCRGTGVPARGQVGRQDKLDYLLGNVNSQVSSGKGGFFREVAGFKNKSDLDRALRRHFYKNFDSKVYEGTTPVTNVKKWNITGIIDTPNGPKTITATWQQSGGNGAWELITAVPAVPR